jgi:hypothetical protein
MALNSVKVKFSDKSNNYWTSVSEKATKESCKAYFVGQIFNVGIYPVEDLQECIGIEFRDNN